jgi:signal transduction histidine kinase
MASTITAVETEGVRGIDDLAALAETLTNAGLPTRVTFSGDRPPLPHSVDRAVYAIAREALTNTLRHAGPASARVCLSYGNDRLFLDVSDDGRGGTVEGGLGIAGMRQRAGAVGGYLEAGPRRSGGFRVRASLPMRRRP